MSSGLFQNASSANGLFQEPILPGALEQAKLRGKQFVQAGEDYKSNKKLMPRFKDTETIKTPKNKIQIITRPGRPSLKLVDVGGKFIEVEERLRRIGDAERRAKRAAVKRANTFALRNADN